jgi:hypothetical protein
LLIYSANGVYPTGAVCRIILHNKHDFIKTIFALDACFQQELFQQTISWRVLPEQGKRLTLDRGFIISLSVEIMKGLGLFSYDIRASKIIFCAYYS